MGYLPTFSKILSSTKLKPPELHFIKGTMHTSLDSARAALSAGASPARSGVIRPAAGVYWNIIGLHKLFITAFA